MHFKNKYEISLAVQWLGLHSTGMSLIPGLEIQDPESSTTWLTINKIYDPLKKVHMISLQAYRSLGR